MDEAIRRVRAFNRLVTERIGALQGDYLARRRTLGASRLLWEIGVGGAGGVEVRELRARLSLDSGYVSRMLRALEGEGLVIVAASDRDRRVRFAALTATGRAEWRVLDRRSDALAASLLAPLSSGQRERLVAAMADVERLLTGSLVEITRCDPGDPAAVRCLDAYYRELSARFQAGFDPDRVIRVGEDEMRPPAGVFLLATLRSEAIGCGAVLFHGRRRPAEIKRMWVDPSARGLGVGRRLLAELEHHARAHGAPTARLETNRALTEAIAMYRADGFREVPPFNDEPHATHWFEKSLRTRPTAHRRHQ